MQSKCTHHDFSRHISRLLRDRFSRQFEFHIIGGEKFGVHLITKMGVVCCDMGEKETLSHAHYNEKENMSAGNGIITEAMNSRTGKWRAERIQNYSSVYTSNYHLS
jgi:hypothetical protein